MDIKTYLSSPEFLLGSIVVGFIFLLLDKLFWPYLAKMFARLGGAIGRKFRERNEKSRAKFEREVSFYKIRSEDIVVRLILYVSLEVLLLLSFQVSIILMNELTFFVKVTLATLFMSWGIYSMYRIFRLIDIRNRIAEDEIADLKKMK
jgi:hypothetical protein